MIVEQNSTVGQVEASVSKYSGEFMLLNNLTFITVYLSWKLFQKKGIKAELIQPLARLSQQERKHAVVFDKPPACYSGVLWST
jgi:hypothetical protein